MPRDLTALVKEDAISNMSPLDRSNNQAEDDAEPKPDKFGNTQGQPTMFAAQAENNSKRNDLHPYTQTLTLRDVESCTVLEELAFPPNERASREKFQYRLSKCSELSLGIFTSSESSSVPTYNTAAPVYSGAPQRKCVLLGHIVATKTTGLAVSDHDMSRPTDSDATLGNKPEGRTVAIHSLAVLPDYQHKGLGSTLMKAYLDRLAKQDVADKAALIAHEDMIPYYERFGFKNRGKSAAQFGGGGWFDMVKDLSEEKEDDY